MHAINYYWLCSAREPCSDCLHFWSVNADCRLLEQNLLFFRPWRPCRGQKSSKHIHYVNIDNLHPKESVCKLTNDHKDCWLTDCVPITRRSQKHPSAQEHHLHPSGSPTDPLPHKLSKLGNPSKSAQDDQAVVRCGRGDLSTGIRHTQLEWNA